MKDIKRVTFVATHDNQIYADNNGHWVSYDDVVQKIKELKSQLDMKDWVIQKLEQKTERDNASHAYFLLCEEYGLKGGLVEYVDSLHLKINELESQSRINEIKSQGINEAVMFANENIEQHDGAIEYRIDILDYADKLREEEHDSRIN